MTTPQALPLPLPPSNAEAERGVIGSVLIDPPAYDLVAPIVQAEDFYHDDHRIIWAHIVAMRSAGAPADYTTLAESLRKAGVYDRVGGIDRLHEISRSVPHSANAEFYARIVREKAMSRQLAEGAAETLREVYANQLSAEQLLAGAEARILAVGNRGIVRQPWTPLQTIKKVDEALERRSRGKLPGVATGLVDLDHILGGGLINGTLTIIAGRPSMGKAQPLDAKILTPVGFVEMGSLKVGDKLIGSDGKPCNVTGVYPRGELDAYRVTMSDGGSTECCDEHLWFTQTRNERRRGIAGSVKPLHQIAATLYRDKHSPVHVIPTVSPVQFDPRPWPEIEPYALGLLLGDGSFRSRCVGFTNPEDDICRRLADMLPIGDELVKASAIQYRIRRRKKTNAPSFVRAALIKMGLDGLNSKQKFIPEEYLLGSVHCRTDLLRGLMDSDGSVNNSGRSVEYSTSSPRLAADVAALTRSLGGMVSTSSRIPVYAYLGRRLEGTRSYRMVVDFPGDYLPISSEKHLAKWIPADSRYYRSIVSVEPIGPRPCQCITVDAPDRLYVTDDYIVTHNSALGLRICEHAAVDLGLPTLLISLEMDLIEIGVRVYAGMSGIDTPRLNTSRGISPLELSRLDKARGRYGAGGLHIEDPTTRSMASIASVVRRMRATHKIALVVIDYVQLISGTGEGDRGVNRQEVVSAISAGLKQLARECKIPVVAMAQLNRGVEQRENKRPLMSDLRESGALENDAHVVMLLYRADYYKADDSPGEAEVIVGKNRNGATGIVKLAWNKELTRFNNVETRYDKDYF